MKNIKKLKKGFTLVELVVVIAVIAILAAVSVGAYFGVTESAKNSKADQEAKAIHTSIMLVVNDPNVPSVSLKDGVIVGGETALVAALEDITGLNYVAGTTVDSDGKDEEGNKIDGYIGLGNPASTVIYTTTDNVVRNITVSTGAIAAPQA